MKNLIIPEKTNFRPFLGDFQDFGGVEPLICKSWYNVLKKRFYGFPYPIVCDIYENVTISYRPGVFVVKEMAVFYMGLS